MDIYECEQQARDARHALERDLCEQEKYGHFSYEDIRMFHDAQVYDDCEYVRSQQVQADWRALELTLTVEEWIMVDAWLQQIEVEVDLVEMAMKVQAFRNTQWEW